MNVLTSIDVRLILLNRIVEMVLFFYVVEDLGPLFLSTLAKNPAE